MSLLHASQSSESPVVERVALTRWAKLLSDVAGVYVGPRVHCEEIAITSAALGTSTSALFKLEPWDRDATKTAIALVGAAIITDLQLEVLPGPGMVNRVFEMRWAWAPSTQTVTTIDHLRLLPTFGGQTIGSNVSISDCRFELPCKFDDVIQPILKPGALVGGRPVFYLYLKTFDWGTPLGASDHLLKIIYKLQYDCYGMMLLR